MKPFDLINTDRYRSSPFSVPCPHCGGTTAYRPDQTKAFPTHASKVAVEYGGADRDALEGLLFGGCQCTNRECQEYTYFVGPYVTEQFDEEPPTYLQRYRINYFHPAIPLIDVPPKAPEAVRTLLQRSFAVAFTDQSASGNLLRSAIESLLSEFRVARFVLSKGKRKRLTLHDRITLIPAQHQNQKDKLLAIKWIGNFASHDTLDKPALRAGFEIVEDVLEDVYGTRRAELMRTVKRINRRRRP